MSSLTLELDDADLARAVAGVRGEHLRIVERQLGVQVGQRGLELMVAGDAASVGLAVKLLGALADAARKGRAPAAEDVERSIKTLLRDGEGALKSLQLKPVLTQPSGRAVVPKSLAQKAYIEQIRAQDIVFGVGPAGTGKTYLAMAMAVSALLDKKVKRIVLARPAVEAGEKLGFLPGDLAEKVNPYLRPLYDALNDMMEPEKARALIDDGVVEVAPLAFMRGRTLNDCFAILDEAQNTTVEQMKMFLTRLGFHSKAVVTGDVTQVDLPAGRLSGLVHAQRILQGIEGVGFSTFTDVDVVRHPLVQQVIRAYERSEVKPASAHEVTVARPSAPSDFAAAPQGKP